MVRGEEAGHFHKVVGMSIVVAGGPCFATDTLTAEEALKLHVINLREQHPMMLHFTSQETFFNTESCSVDEACKKKRMYAIMV